MLGRSSSMIRRDCRALSDIIFCLKMSLMGILGIVPHLLVVGDRTLSS